MSNIPLMNLDSEGRLIMTTPDELKQNKVDQKNIKTCKNTVESPKNWLENLPSSNPIYNMRVTIDKI